MDRIGLKNGLKLVMRDPSKSPSLFSDALRSELKEIVREVFREEMKTLSGINAVEERLLDTKQVAEILGVSESYLEHNAHRLPFTRRLGSKLLRFSYVAMLKFIESKKLP
jgi:predicted DNA-binding transcriptional regulator AlpA